MKYYFLRSLRQLYLIFFAPTQFGREVESTELQVLPLARLSYLITMSPWLFALTLFGNFCLGELCTLVGIPFNWKSSALGIIISFAYEFTFGILGGVAFGPVLGTELSIVLGALFGLSPVFISNFNDIVVSGFAGGLAIGIAGGLAFGLAIHTLEGKSNAIAMVVAVFISTLTTGFLTYIVLAGSTSIRLTITVALIAALAITSITIIFIYVYERKASIIPIGLASTALIALFAAALYGVSGKGVVIWLVMITVAGVVFSGIASAWISITISAVWLLILLRPLFYPVSASLSAITYYVGKRRHAMLRVWQWCPVVWDELLWLPLPFLGKQLALLVQEDREEGFRRIEFVAKERKSYRHNVLNALTRVAAYDLQASSIPKIRDVSKKLSWTVNSPVALPEELKICLIRFDRIASHVGQYLSLNSLSRKVEALDIAIDELKEARSDFIGMWGGAAPYLLRAADEWGRVLGVERENLRTPFDIFRETANPFVYGGPVAETAHNIFTGRHDVVKQIEESLLNTLQIPTLLLYGPRRMGKTSILNQLPRLLGNDFVPCVMDCQNPAVTETRTSILIYISQAIIKGLRKRHVLIDLLDSSSLELRPFAAFDDWLDKVEEIMPSEMRVLLCLDEYEEIQYTQDEGWRIALLNEFRHILQHRKRIRLMFTGAHTFEHLGKLWTDRFLNVRRIRVSFLTREEVFPLLTKPTPDFDISYAENVLNIIFNETRGQPFLTQAVAYELVQFLNEQRRKMATMSDIEETIVRVLDKAGEYFPHIWNDAGGQGQAIMRAVIARESLANFPIGLQWLRGNDILDEKGNFTVPLVERWVQRKITAHS
jgi:DNA polymerase III delta prime subunit